MWWLQITCHMFCDERFGITFVMSRISQIKQLCQQLSFLDTKLVTKFSIVLADWSRSFSSSPGCRFSFTCPSLLNKTPSRKEDDNSQQEYSQDGPWIPQAVADYKARPRSSRLIHSSRNGSRERGDPNVTSEVHYKAPCTCIPLSFLRLSFRRKKKLDPVHTCR